MDQNLAFEIIKTQNKKNKWYKITRIIKKDQDL